MSVFLLDTDHLESMGGETVSQREYRIFLADSEFKYFRIRFCADDGAGCDAWIREDKNYGFYHD